MSQDIPEIAYAEIAAKAEVAFPGSRVSCHSGEWVIYTGLSESREVDADWVGTPAEMLHQTFEMNYGTDLERWAWKNGFGDVSLREAALAYNQTLKNHEIADRQLRQKLIDMGRQDVIDSIDNGTFNEEQLAVADAVEETL